MLHHTVKMWWSRHQHCQLFISLTRSLSLSLSAHSLRGGSGYDIHVESHLFDNWFEWLLSINNTLHANGGWHSHEFTWIHSHRKMHVLTQPALSLYISPAMCVQQNFTGDAHIQNAHNTRMVVVLLLNVYSSSMHFLLALRWALQAASWIPHPNVVKFYQFFFLSMNHR